MCSGWKVKRGMITVEASFLVPWTFMVIIVAVVLTWAVHNRVWYTSASLEAALAGNQYIPGIAGTGRAGRSGQIAGHNPAGTQKAEQTATTRIRDQVMPGSAPDATVECTHARTTVTFSRQTYPVLKDLFDQEIRESVQKIRPVPVVRAAWALKDVWNRWKEEDG